MVVLKSKLPDQAAYDKIVDENPERHLGYIVAKVFGGRIYVRKYQQDLTRQYSTAFVGKAIFGEGGSTIKGMFIPTLQMTFFRVLFLGMLFYSLTPDFFTYGRWNIGATCLLAVLFLFEVVGIRKKRQIKCAVIRSIEATFQAELLSPKGKYREKPFEEKDEYEVWHCKLLFWVYLLMTVIFSPVYVVFAVFGAIAQLWYGTVFFMALALYPVVYGIIFTEWMWRIRFSREGVALKVFGREKLSFAWDEIQGIGLAYTYRRGGLQVWMYFSKDALVHPDFREVMKRNQRNPKVIWLQYSKKNDEILRRFYQGKIVNYDFLKGFTQ